jgi:hypothetical protein
MELLTASNPKVLKSKPFGYETFIMHLAPADRSGNNVCSHSSAGCRAACLNTSGRGCYQRTQNARIRRTKIFFEDRVEFFALLMSDIYTGIRRAKSHNLTPCFRLNGTSDIPFDRIMVPGYNKSIFDIFPNVQFYDYTKVPRRVVPANYHLTFSRSESNSENVNSEISRGRNVAVVFHKVPETYKGIPVIIGDTSDLRFLDKRHVIVGLTAKGKAKKDKSGFVL